MPAAILAAMIASLIGGGAEPAASSPVPAAPQVVARSAAVYRLPYADGTRISVFDDDASHRPLGALDLVGEPRGDTVHRIVAAAGGVVMAIEDGHREQQSGRAAAECRNNYVWLAHPNGEWTLYSHMRPGTTHGKAGLKVGDAVKAGQYLGDEGAVGCAMLSHLHFEVAVPRPEQPIDPQGFLTDNARRERIRIPRFCGVTGERVSKDAFYTAAACPK